MNTYLSDEQIYEWLRDEFNKGKCPRWFGDSADLVFAVVRHAEVIEKRLDKAEKKIQKLEKTPPKGKKR